MAEECVISFSALAMSQAHRHVPGVKLMEMPLEGWSLLFACKEERLPSLYVSKSGVLAASKAKSKSGGALRAARAAARLEGRLAAATAAGGAFVEAEGALFGDPTASE